METNMSSMDYTQSNWSKVVFNDTKELAKKQSQNGTSGYSRRLFSKMKRTSTPAKQRLRSNIYHKHLARSKQTSSVQTKATNKLTENIVNDRKPENEVWNMIQQYRLVPTIENLAVVNNSIEKTYKFIENAIDINNNGNESHITLNEHTDRTSSIDNTYSDTTYEDADDRTITNTSSLSWEYSDFQNDISPEAASTFISEEKENIPFMAAPRKYVQNEHISFYLFFLSDYNRTCLSFLLQSSIEFDHILR